VIFLPQSAHTNPPKREQKQIRAMFEEAAVRGAKPSSASWDTKSFWDVIKNRSGPKEEN